MARNLIIGISLLLFAAAGFVMYRALGLEPTGAPAGAVAMIPEKRVEAPPAAPALVDELRARISELEEKIAARDETVESPEGERVRVLAVLHGEDGFSSGQVRLGNSTLEGIIGIIPDILDSPEDRVVVAGHTDNKPVKASAGKRYLDNMELSFLRAKAVALEIVKSGIPVERVEIVGYGDSRPVASNDTSEGRAMNRRVEISLVPAGTAD